MAPVTTMTKPPINIPVPHTQIQVEIITLPPPPISILHPPSHTHCLRDRYMTKVRPIIASETQFQNFELSEEWTGSLSWHRGVRHGASAATLCLW